MAVVNTRHVPRSTKLFIRNDDSTVGADKKRQIWVEARFLISSPLSSVGLYIGCSVASTIEPRFLAEVSSFSRKCEPKFLTKKFLTSGRLLYMEQAWVEQRVR